MHGVAEREEETVIDEEAVEGGEVVDESEEMIFDMSTEDKRR
jgi:hypothetical protein